MKIGSWISGISSFAAIVGFFLPWILVSCSGQQIASLSGYQLSRGGIVPTAYGMSDPIPGKPKMFVILGAVGISLLIFVLSFFFKGLSKYFSGIQILLGIIGAIFLYIARSEIHNEWIVQGEGLFAGVELYYQLLSGFWITTFGIAGIIIGGVIGLAGEDRKEETDEYDLTSRLQKLIEQREAGHLTEEEFEMAKKILFEE